MVYLLHGYSGSYRDWPSHMNLRILADRYEVILVCPDGGHAGWYLDSPVRPLSRYETHICGELLPYIDDHYRTITGPEGRAICGLSMGGHGAFLLLIKYPQLFCAAGSMSGVLDIRPFADKYELTLLLGSPDQFAERWRRETCIERLPELQRAAKGLLIDCGVADFTIDINRQAHLRLLELGIPHDYYERPGGHSWSYWTGALESHLLFFKRYLQMTR